MCRVITASPEWEKIQTLLADSASVGCFSTVYDELLGNSHPSVVIKLICKPKKEANIKDDSQTIYWSFHCYIPKDDKIGI